ncbi:hypothetical protein HPB52_002914 [Rhipicephalus sanguineus]|uniref:CCHC-type domain-containing protein n=1 Tax=Rhipicephalus sanguineus TaxID=34632 RepID=A0A9D4T2S1_RHISA|nr:hypothetical protein HPB52_002914 [Rhipicephalus sanguineus]
MPEAMVEGEPITHEEASAPGWIDAIRRRATSSTTTTSKPAGASVGALRTGAASRVAAASRLPPLPTDHHRVIVRPGGGLDRRQRKISSCTNDTQNIFVISTPSLQTAEAYAKVRAIVLMERAHPVSAYVVASGTTSRGVVRGVDADLPDSELQRLFVSSHNPTLMGVRRIRILPPSSFSSTDLKSPTMCAAACFCCVATLYKRQIDTCRNCGRVGHRQDVCPTPSEKVCEHCGIKPTGPDHVCVTPKCALCGQAHITGDRTCPNRYQIPYVVRRRRRRRRRRNNNQQTQGGSAKQQPTPKQPTPSPPTKHLPTTTKSPTATPTWADRVAGKENAEFKALIRNLQQPSERVVEAPTPAAPVVEPAPTTSSNASRAAKRRAAEDPPDEPVTMSKLMEALARLRADIAADRAADMTPHTLQLTELHARLQILEGQHTAVPPSQRVAGFHEVDESAVQHRSLRLRFYRPSGVFGSGVQHFGPCFYVFNGFRNVYSKSCAYGFIGSSNGYVLIEIGQKRKPVVIKKSDGSSVREEEDGTNVYADGQTYLFGVRAAFDEQSGKNKLYAIDKDQVIGSHAVAIASE